MGTLKIFVKWDSIEGCYLIGFSFESKDQEKIRHIIFNLGCELGKIDKQNDWTIEFNPIFRGKMIKEYKLSGNAMKIAENAANALRKWIDNDEKQHRP